MLKIAITGNIASGKSEIEKFLIKNGHIVYDTDVIAHNILDTVTDFYGYDVFTNGKINRHKLGQLVFNNNEIKDKLEKLVHPKVKDKILEIFNKHVNDEIVFISVPLLYEAGFEKLFDKVIMVTVDSGKQLERLMKRNNLSKADALKRINSQIPQEYKIEKADYIVYNNSSIENLLVQISTIINELISEVQLKKGI